MRGTKSRVRFQGKSSLECSPVFKCRLDSSTFEVKLSKFKLEGASEVENVNYQKVISRCEKVP